MHPISHKELLYAQISILTAIVLQGAVSFILHLEANIFIIVLELFLVIIVGYTAPKRDKQAAFIHHVLAFLLIGVISIANFGQLLIVTSNLLSGSHVDGKYLLLSALAIFFTNIIIFGLWYWEMDSPGLTGKHDEVKQADFYFTQSSSEVSKTWQPTFFDYLYLSVTNSTAFSPTDTIPLTHVAKTLMSIQALIALLTIVIITARAVNILG